MNNPTVELLDTSIDCLLAGDPPNPGSKPALSELLLVAGELHRLPAPDFQKRLRIELARATARRAQGQSTVPLADGSGSPDHDAGRQMLRTSVPPRFSTETFAFPLGRSRLALSFALHVAALALVGASSMYVSKDEAVRTKVAQLVPATADYLFPVAPGRIGGGGGGGDHDKLTASNGTPPRFTTEQLTPPMVVARNQDPRLPAEATVVGPPELRMPQSDRLGDPLAAVLAPPSNGTGSEGGIGSGRRGGVGSGDGAGVGEGSGGGLGGGIFRVGGGVSAPRAVYDPDPEYSDEARKAKYQGEVVLEAIIGSDGRPRSLRIVRSLGMGLDQKALDAVQKWRFVPAMRDGRAVNVVVDIEVAFRLY